MSKRYRNRPTRDYTVVRNAALRNPALSLKAKGALAMMLSFPDDWEYHLEQLEPLSRDGRDALRAAIRELENAGYITRRQTRKPDGTLGDSEYNVTDDVRTADGKPVHGAKRVQNGASTVDGLSVAGQTVAGLSVAGKPAATKTDYTKTEITKKNTPPTPPRGAAKFDPATVDLPGFLDPNVWADFVKHRREIRHALTRTQTTKLLDKLAATPGDANAMLERSVENGWRGVFPLDKRKSNGKPQPLADPTDFTTTPTPDELLTVGGKL